MMQPQDEDRFQRLLGQNEVPQDIRREYEVWKGMYDRDGNSGALGTLGCIAIARSLGYEPPSAKAKRESVEWRNLPVDGSVRIEAHFFGDWQPGTFHGFVDAGTLAVRLDNDENTRECLPHVVRLAQQVEPADSGEDQQFDIDLTEDEDQDTTEAESGVIQKAGVASGGK